jgi:hypothetical protein
MPRAPCGRVDLADWPPRAQIPDAERLAEVKIWSEPLADFGNVTC